MWLKRGSPYASSTGSSSSKNLASSLSGRLVRQYLTFVVRCTFADVNQAKPATVTRGSPSRMRPKYGRCVTIGVGVGVVTRSCAGWTPPLFPRVRNKGGDYLKKRNQYPWTPSQAGHRKLGQSRTD